ncbi:MAG: hypothetical protein GYB31_07555 [Bacteroidetes bacterium]|nr:hypothetical protein [Bacteroidota bacterium]
MSENQKNDTPGFTCPNCKSFIPLDIETLLMDGDITCPKCRTTFKLDNPPSRDILEKLKSVDKALKKNKGKIQ